MMVELLMGLTLVSLVLIGLLQLFPSAERSVVVADRTTQANHLARKLMEQTLARPYSDLSLGSVQGSTTMAHTQRRGARATVEFLYSVDVTQPEVDREIKEIYVRVEWSEAGSTRGVGPHILLHGSKGNLW